jgi:hypothetical protein
MVNSRLISAAGPATHAAEVTLSGDTPLATPARALYVGVSGDLEVTTTEGDKVTLVGVPTGILPVAVSIVHQTGTTATDIVALW